MDDFFKDIYFPYSSVRKGQDEFIKKVYSTINHKKNLMVHAPTGLGKTVSALAPALKIAKEKGLTIVYLTSRQTQANQVIKTIKDINNTSSESINYVAFIGKRSMCVHQEKDLYPPQDFNEFCKKMKEKGRCSFYKNLKNEDYEDSIQKIIEESSNNFLDAEGFVDLCYYNKLCPYEIAAKKAFKADIVICDYNYMFTPGIRETFLGKIGRVLEECILIVDEAHNLADRVRNSYSYSLNTDMIKNALEELKDYVKTSGYDQYLTNLSAAIEEIYFEKILGDKNETLIRKEDFIEFYLKKVGSLTGYSDIVETLKDIEKLVKEDRVISHVGRVASFLEKFKEYDEENFLRVLDKRINKDKTLLNLRLRCLDPSKIAADTLNYSYSTILMSGTLSPINMFKDIIGIANADLLELDSPFIRENQKMIVLDDVTTKFSARSKDMYKKIAAHVENILNSAPSKNSIIFFPSYDLLDRIVSEINLSRIDRKVLREQRYMTKEDKEKFVFSFKSSGSFNEKSKVLFALTSGSFAEGLDLPEEMLELVVVVGLPLSMPDLYVNSLIAHFDKKFKKGQLYGYIYPAMTKIIQAAGRCIRTETDRGVVVLMDNRFLWPLYAQSFPKHYRLERNKDYKLEIGNFFD